MEHTTAPTTEGAARSAAPVGRDSSGLAPGEHGGNERDEEKFTQSKPSRRRARYALEIVHNQQGGTRATQDGK